MIPLPEEDREFLQKYQRRDELVKEYIYGRMLSADEFKEIKDLDLFLDPIDKGAFFLSIISRYQKALEKAVEQRDEEIDLITTHGYFSSNGKDGHNFEIQNILNGGEG